MMSDQILDGRDSIRPHHGPGFQSPETTTEWDLPVSVIGDQPGVRVIVFNNSGFDRERIGQVTSTFYKQAARKIGSLQCKHDVQR